MLASAFKGAAVRTIIHFLAHKAQSVPIGDDAGRYRALAAWAASSYVYSCGTSGCVFNAAQKADAVTAGRAYTLCYAWLARAAARSEVRNWRLRPKAHYFEHVVDRIEATARNPRFHATWMEETLMGKMKRMVGATRGSVTARRGLQRYLLFMSVRWRSRRKAGRWIAPS